jgi:hypothetical protein
MFNNFYKSFLEIRNEGNSVKIPVPAKMVDRVMITLQIVREDFRDPEAQTAIRESIFTK